MNVRSMIFKFKDIFFDSGSFKKNLCDLKSEFNNDFKNQHERITKILGYAVDNVEYYSKYCGNNGINCFPVIQKKNISLNYDRFVSLAYKEKLNKLHKVTTSGSYGTPFTFYLNKDKRSKMVAEIYFFGAKSGLKVGKRHAHLLSKKKSKYAQILHNQYAPFVGKLNDSWASCVINKLNTRNIKVLVGYPSAIAMLAGYLHGQNMKLELEGIITISEVLTPEVRNKIEDAFSCKVVSRYTTEEFGVLANQDMSGDFFYLNQCNYFIEILKLDSNEPAALGELGRIVVTDLFNLAMPFIRYDTGDLARPYEIKNNLVTKIYSVEGRSLAIIYNTDGERVSSFQINGALREFTNILQFQFSQEGRTNYLLKIVSKSILDEDKIISLYKGILGDDATINIVYLDDIPAQNSGKRPYILQNYFN